MTKSLEDMNVAELLDHAKKADKDAGLLRTLLDDPATRKDTLELVKKKNPGMAIPEIEVAAAQEAALAEERKARQKLEAEVREIRQYESLRAERERVMEEHGLSKNDLKEVEKLMVDDKAPIPHFDAAVKVFKASQVMAEPTSASLTPQLYEMPEKSVWGAGVGNKSALDKIAKQAAYDAVNALRSKRSAA